VAISATCGHAKQTAKELHLSDPVPARAARLRALPDILRQRILVLDGAMGTMLQRIGLTEADYRGSVLADHPADLRGNHDLL
jgi:5-methyltetrahydrofolate--homocysteine methyltransferase